jgi:hypothetical protein
LGTGRTQIEYKIDNKSKIKEYQKEYYEDNKNNMIERRKQYYEDTYVCMYV